ncbi:MAG: transglycosylase domain-containing protein [Bacteroidota bacterium]
MKQSLTYFQSWSTIARATLQDAQERWMAFRKKYPFLIFLGIITSILSGIAFLSVMVFVMLINFGAYGKLPTSKDLTNLTNYQATEVFAEDGSVLGRYYFENRAHVRYDEISSDFVNALIATEDVRFFQHHGLDLRAWVRVLFKTVIMKNSASGGGSTLTQQLAKNLYPREDHGKFSLVINKIQEVIIASRLERVYNKEQILELYLNTVPFSENTFGIRVAAHRFFNTTPRRLDVAQSAVLVGMLKATSSYNPIRFPERSVERRNIVFEQMAKYGYLDRMAVDSLKASKIKLDYRPLSNNHGSATHFREHLRLELKELLADKKKENGMPYNIYTDGLKVYTTIDPVLQEYAEEAMQVHMKELQKSFEEHLGDEPAWENDTVLLIGKYNSDRYHMLREGGYSEWEIDSIFDTPIEMKVFDWEKGEKMMTLSPMDSIKYYLAFLNAGFLVAEPQTGKVKVWLGGIDHKYFQYDKVRSKRQVGSTFKPIVYANALRKGIPPCTYTGNYLRTYYQYEGWTPKNADNKYGGSYSMQGGLINSINTISVSMAMRGGPKSVAELAQQLGIDQDIPGVPAIALGAVEVSLFDMVQVYGTFVNRGVRPELTYITKVETPSGEVLLDLTEQLDTSKWEKVLESDHADMIRNMLATAVDRGTGVRLRYKYKFTNDIGGKTGTSQNHSDGWFMGFTPNLVAGSWVGAESPAVRFRSLRLGQGANTALPIFAEFLLRVKEDKNYEHYVNAEFPELNKEVAKALKCSDCVLPKKEESEEGVENTPTEEVVASVGEE